MTGAHSDPSWCHSINHSDSVEHDAVWLDPSSVRVTVGVPTETHSERRTIAVEQFLSMLRFEQRDKLAELPGGWR